MVMTAGERDIEVEKRDIRVANMHYAVMDASFAFSCSESDPMSSFKLSEKSQRST